MLDLAFHVNLVLSAQLPPNLLAVKNNGKSVIDLTGSSPPRNTSPGAEVRIRALLTEAIDDASPELLRQTLHALSTTSSAFATLLSDLLLVTRRITEDSPLRSDHDDSDMDEDEEIDSDEYFDKGVVRTSQKKGNRLESVRTRYAKCTNCEEEFDVCDNWDDEGCDYHDGIRQ